MMAHEQNFWENKRIISCEVNELKINFGLRGLWRYLITFDDDGIKIKGDENVSLRQS